MDYQRVKFFKYSGVCHNERCYNERMLQRRVLSINSGCYSECVRILRPT